MSLRSFGQVDWGQGEGPRDSGQAHLGGGTHGILDKFVFGLVQGRAVAGDQGYWGLKAPWDFGQVYLLRPGRGSPGDQG